MFSLRLRWLALIFSLALIQQSCSAFRANNLGDFYRENPPALFRHAIQQSLELPSLTGEGFLTLESPDGGFTGYAQVTYKRPDSLLIKLRTGYGVSLGEILLVNDRVYIYNIRDRVLIRSEGETLPLQDMLGMELNVSDLFAAALGSPRLPLSADLALTWWDSLRYVIDQKYIRYSLQLDDMFREYVADPDLGAFVATSQVQLGQKDTIRYEFKRFRKIKKYRLPQHIQILRSQSRQRLSLYYNRLQVGRKISPNTFRIQISDDVDVINLGSL